MTFRVTSLAIENQAIRFAARHNADIFRYQQQITSGLRFTRPSEQPHDFRAVSSLNLRFNELGVELSTIRTAESILNASVSQLQEANVLITAASTAVQQGIQSTETIDNNALALEVEGILAQFKTLANSAFNNQFLYGGTKTNRQPFEFSDPVLAGRSLNVQYFGSQNSSEVRISEALLIETYYAGQSIFSAASREPTILIGQTGAATGSGTDTLASRADLLVLHDATNFAGASGILPGSSSNSLDTILGDHSITIVDTSGTGTAGTISLDGGTPIPFDDLQTDLRVEGPNGEIVYVNTTSIAAGFSGTITASGAGSLSVDGGATRTAIDFSNNQVVRDSSGGFVTINSSAIVRTGTDRLEFPGTSDAFQLLHNIIADLRNDRALSGTDRSQALDRRLGELQSLRESLLSAIGEQSTSLRTLESVGVRNQTLALQVQTDASAIQATNFSEAALRLTNSESLLQFTFAVTAQIQSINILDFLS